MAELLIKSEPLYIQLQKKLMSFIAEKRPSMLPDERSIADFFKVSRITVRKALEELEIDGVVERIQGRGTLVRKGTSGASTDIVVLAGAASPLTGALSDRIGETDARLRRWPVAGFGLVALAILLGGALMLRA